MRPNTRWAVDIVADELARTDDLPAAFAAASRRLPLSTKAQGLSAGVTALVLRAPHVRIAHIGAGRAYRVREGVLRRLTEDHVLEVEGAYAGFVVLRQLGHEPAAPDVSEDVFDADDRYLVVDSTVARAVSDAEILAAMMGNDPPTAVETLVNLAFARVHDRRASAAVGFVRRTRERL